MAEFTNLRELCARVNSEVSGKPRGTRSLPRSSPAVICDFFMPEVQGSTRLVQDLERGVR